MTLSSILRVARLVIAAPVVVEVDGVWYVKGSYSEMAEYLPKIKRLGLNYNPSDRTWFIPRAKFTPALLQKVQDIFDPTSAKSLKDKAKKEKKEQLEMEANKAKVEKLVEVVKDMLAEKYISVILQWREGSSLVTLRGNTYPIKDYIKDAGGTYIPPGSWEIDLRKASLEGLQKLKKVVDSQDASMKENIAKVKDLVPKTLSWSLLGITMYIKDGYLVLMGDTRAYRDEIKSVCELAKWSGSWSLPVLQSNGNSLEKLIKRLDLDNKAKEEVKEQPAVPVPTPDSRGIPNRKADRCVRCNLWVEVGEGLATQEFLPSSHNDYDDETLVWVVRHKNKDVCAKHLAEVKEIQEREHLKVKSKSDALRTLRELCRVPKYFEEGNFSPKGTVYRISPGSHGTSIVVESDESHLWYIESNSADGDMWANNNIGGHSMGWRVPMYDAVKDAFQAYLIA